MAYPRAFELSHFSWKDRDERSAVVRYTGLAGCAIDVPMVHSSLAGGFAPKGEIICEPMSGEQDRALTELGGHIGLLLAADRFANHRWPADG